MRVRIDASGRARHAGMRAATGVAMIALLSLSFSAGCGDDEEDQNGTVVDTTVEEGTDVNAAADVTIVDVLRDPERYDGQPVTVAGPVRRVISGPGAFTIGEEAAADPAEQQLVVFPLADADIPDQVAVGMS